MYDMTKDLAKIDQVIAAGHFKDTWGSLAKYQVPQWYKEAKFGIFIHWGVYSVPAFGSEWYPRMMYIEGSPEYEHHRKTYGEQKEFGYKEFIPMFRAERFDPAEWAELFADAGAQYVVPVAEHHDGFQMYKSRISHWNAYEMGPKRDVLGELKDEFGKRGLRTGASSHRIEHWFFLGHGKEFDSDIREPLQRGDLYWPSMPEGDFQEWRISVDYGTANPASFGLWGRQGEIWYRVGEFYYDSRREGRQKTDAEYVRDLRELAEGREITRVIVDPSAASFIEVLRREGFRVVRADNDVADGIRVTADLLKRRRIVICGACADCLREMETYCWDDKGRRDAPKKEQDHAMDDLRYFAMDLAAEEQNGFAATWVERRA